MKNLFLIILLFPSVSLIGQTITCGTGTIEITQSICHNNGNSNSADDYITFVLTGTNTSDETIQSMPLGSIVTPFAKGATITAQVQSVSSLLIQSPGQWTVSVPSPGCSELVFDAILYDQVSAYCPSQELRINGMLPVPTLGQWSLIVLLLLLLIIGRLVILGSLKINRNMTSAFSKS